jgi:PrgI family protein
MQFKVPQFLDIEDKLFGPFTFRQFVYMTGGAGICFVLYKLVGFFWGILPILAIAGFSAALAFYRPNNKPFISMVESAFKYFLQGKLYVWKKEKVLVGNKEKATTQENKTPQMYSEGRLTGNKLKDLAWSLDVLDLSQHRETNTEHRENNNI